MMRFVLIVSAALLPLQDSAVPAPAPQHDPTSKPLSERLKELQKDEELVAALQRGVARIEARQEQVGRFQIVFTPTVLAHTYLLDTVSGSVWLRAVIEEVPGSPTVWTPTPRFDSLEEFETWLSAWDKVERPPAETKTPLQRLRDRANGSDGEKK